MSLYYLKHVKNTCLTVTYYVTYYPILAALSYIHPPTHSYIPLTVSPELCPPSNITLHPTPSLTSLFLPFLHSSTYHPAVALSGFRCWLPWRVSLASFMATDWSVKPSQAGALSAPLAYRTFFSHGRNSHSPTLGSKLK